MTELLIGSTVGFVFVLVAALTPLARRLNLLDIPSGRKNHDLPVPLIGGIVIYIVLLCYFSLFGLHADQLWLLGSISILIVIGVLDDFSGVGVLIRFIAQICAVALMTIGSDLWIGSLGIGGSQLNELPLLGWLLTFIAVIGLTNGFNMIDGIDGLAAGQMLLGMATLGLAMHIEGGELFQVEWIIGLASATFAFLLINLSLTPIAKIFLGDAGSTLLGFTMAWMLIYYSQPPISLISPVAALWCVTLPVFDTIAVILQRLMRWSSPFSGDRLHLHFLLIDAGISQSSALALILTMACLINLLGLFITSYFSPLVGLVTYCLLGLAFGIVVARYAKHN